MVSAHGIGGAQDLPIPAGLAVAGAMAALVVSFLVLAVAWRAPRFDATLGGRPVQPWLHSVITSPVSGWAVRGIAFAFFAYVLWAALAGPDSVTNPTFGVVYVWLWVGIVPASLLFGPFYRSTSPLRTLHLLVTRVSGRDPDRGAELLPGWLGYWPAAVGLFAFVWLELVSTHGTELAVVRLWFAVYAAVMLIGTAVFGSEWFARADPFEVYSALVGHLAVIGRREDGTLVWRSPLANLDGVRVRPGLVAVVSVLLGSTAFDSFRDSNRWLQISQGTGMNLELLNTAMMIAIIMAVGVSFAAATMTTGVDGPDRRRALPNRFAHSMVPIVVGYLVAHYLSFFVETGQQTLIELSDPMRTGADLLGTGDLATGYWLSSHPGTLATVKVLAIVTGHVLGVIAAHDRALKLLPLRHQLRGQLPLLAVMVCYTAAGLYLLFGA